MKLREYGIYLAWLVSITATLGSLYFSEIKHFIPCTFCWYQRILMYPLVIILGIASFRNDKNAIPYAIPLSILGIGVALYHILDQNIPNFGGIGACSAGVPCNIKYINWFGFISIPVLSLIAFSLITASLLLFSSKAEQQAIEVA